MNDDTTARELTVHELLRNQHVKRWHIVHTDRQQTVAEHLWAVTVLGWELYKRMSPPFSWESWTRLLMLHDSTEAITGDLPTPSKKHLRDPEALGYEYSKEYAALDSWATIDQGGLPRAMLKCVDLIEAIRFMDMHGCGAHASSVRRLLQAALARHHAECMKVWPSYPWAVVHDLFNESLLGPEPGRHYDGAPWFHVEPQPEEMT